jgi:glycosyltransferase involved in cell wall biosynthesis
MEIILVDDGSADNSGKIVDDYAKNEQRIKVIHQKNAGVSAARNAGIEKSTGDYICFIDGDDYVEPDYVEYMLKNLLDSDADISLSTEMFSIMHPNQTAHDKTEIYMPEKATCEILYANIPIGCYCKLFRRELLGKDLRFFPEFCMGEGFNFNTTAFQRANKIAVGHHKIYHYRLDNVDSVTTKFSMEKWHNGLDALQNIKRNFVIKMPKVYAAWDFAWWLTNNDILRLMIGAKQQKKYPRDYQECLRVVRYDAPSMSNISGSRARRFRILLIKINPLFAAKFDNYRREKAMKKVMRPTGAIVTITTNNNYGNIMQRWALQKFLRNHGYNFISYYFYGYYVRQYLPRYTRLFAIPRKIVLKLLGKDKFYGKSSSMYNYGKTSKFCNTHINQRVFLPFFHKKYPTYIIGSDQNLNYKVTGKEFFTSWQNFLLKFVKWNAKRISYASSFGSSDISPNGNPLASPSTKALMKKFDALAVREEFGIEMARKLWDIDAREVVDPTMLLSVHEYRELIKNSSFELHDISPVFYYILRDDAKKTQYNFALKVAQDMKVKADGVSGNSEKDLPAVEQWLKGFADAELAITNSFHGLIFSILNHTDFISLCPKRAGGGSVRSCNLLEKLGLLDRIVDEKDFYTFAIEKLPKIDWVKVDEKLNALRNDSAEWLLTHLEDPNGKH